jgi:hypothetical protein
MLTFIQPRLRKPVGIAIAGTMFAAAWAVRGGPTWFLSIVIEVSVLVRAIGLYVWGGEDSDEGAIVGSRMDERQRLIAERSWGMAGKVAMLAAFVGVTVAVALKADWWWPFAAILAVMLFGYLFGLQTYGHGDDGPAEGITTRFRTRSPVSR